MIEVPKIELYNLREHIFTYLKDAMEKDTWDGRTTIRISSLSKSLISIVDSKYNIGSKTKTTTSLLYIGCFRMIDYMNKEEWSKFIDNNANMDMGTISMCDFIGTTTHDNFYNAMFSLHSIGYKWVDNLNAIWPVPDKKQITYHMYNDHRFGKMFDVITDRMGFSVKEAANLFILYAIKDSDILAKNSNNQLHLERIDKLLKYNNLVMNTGIKSFNDSFINEL